MLRIENLLLRGDGIPTPRRVVEESALVQGIEAGNTSVRGSDTKGMDAARHAGEHHESGLGA